MVNDLTPQYISSLVTSTETSRYNLRNPNDIRTVNTRTSQYYNFFLPSTIRVWNALPEEQRNSLTIASFKSHLNQPSTSIPKYEPSHDRTNKMAFALSEDSDQPGHPPSLIRVFPVRMKKACAHCAHSEDSDQTGRMPRRIWVFAGRTVTLLVLIRVFAVRMKKAWVLSYPLSALIRLDDAALITMHPAPLVGTRPAFFPLLIFVSHYAPPYWIKLVSFSLYHFISRIIIITSLFTEDNIEVFI